MSELPPGRDSHNRFNLECSEWLLPQNQQFNNNKCHLGCNSISFCTVRLLRSCCTNGTIKIINPPNVSEAP